MYLFHNIENLIIEKVLFNFYTLNTEFIEMKMLINFIFVKVSIGGE